MPGGFHNHSLNSPNGGLKTLHLILGGICILLVATSYVPYWALDVFLSVVCTCFAISSMNLFFLLLFDKGFSKTKTFQAVSTSFHIIGGVLLIAAGIDLIGWSDYDERCGFKCPRIYEIGVAKILAFINGTLYGIHGFLEAKGGRDEDFYSESLPLRGTPGGIPPTGTFHIEDATYLSPSPALLSIRPSLDNPKSYQNSFIYNVPPQPHHSRVIN